jgi:hypothetical protein
MRKLIATGLILSIFPASVAFAFPDEKICVYPKKNGQPDTSAKKVVSKKRLALFFLQQDTDTLNLAQQVEERPEIGPDWQRIFIDPNFCKATKDPACIGPHFVGPNDPSIPPGVKLPDDGTAAAHKADVLRRTFWNAVQTDVNGTFFSMDKKLLAKDYLTLSREYFTGDDSVNAITCVKDLPPAVTATNIKMPEGLRLRAHSDDLNVDQSKKVYAGAFKHVDPATISFERDGVGKINKVNAEAALGYAIPLFGKSPPSSGPFSSSSGLFSGEVVPYISTSQSSKKVDGMNTTFTDTNNVAVGALLNTELTFFDSPVDITHIIQAKPQYLWNTKDKSEIASLKFIYAPWTLGAVKLNTPKQLGPLLGASWLQLLFDVRSDFGEYTKKSDDPMLAMTQSSFSRAGSKFGFSFSTNDKTAHVVLTVTETLLYGFTGSVKHIDLFESSLSFYFDSTSNYAFTLSYSKGQNEDTAENAQTFKAGLSAKF